MKSTTPPQAFIPVWLDDAGLTQAEFRLYCHLCRRADRQTGIAWPSYESMEAVCGVSHTTVWRTLKAIEKRKLIAKVGKPFGGSCRYKILVPIVSPEERLKASNSFTTGTIESAPIVSQLNSNHSPDETPIVSPEEREGITNKVNQVRETNSCALSIFEVYPRKDAKKPALAAIEKALKKNTAEHLLEKTKLFAELSQGKETRYIPHASTFFNQERFNDDPETWRQSNSAASASSSLNLGKRSKHHRAGEYPENLQLPDCSLRSRHKHAGIHEPELIEKGF